MKPAALDLLRVDGVIDEPGEDHVYGNVYEACADRIPAGSAQATTTPRPRPSGRANSSEASGAARVECPCHD